MSVPVIKIDGKMVPAKLVDGKWVPDEDKKLVIDGDKLKVEKK